MKQFFSLSAAAIAILSASSTVQADCFTGSGKAGVIRNLDRPWVFTAYLPDKATGEGHYRVKSFGVNLAGKLECKGSKTFCSTEHGSVSLKKTERGLEMKFSTDLAVEKQSEDDDLVKDQGRSEATKPAQVFNLVGAHSDVCYDAFFKTSNYDEYAKAHGNQTTFPLEKPVASPSLGRSAAIPDAE